MKRVFFAVFAVLAVLLTGCVSSGEKVFPADISLSELESRINKATDPEGVFAASKSYIMKQEVRVRQFLDDDDVKMVELKFEKPDKLALLTYDDNQLSSIFCTDGKRGWVADCKSRKIVQLENEGLKRMQLLSRLSRPGSGGYADVFSKVELDKCIDDDGEFYRITCYPENQPYPICFYVDIDEFLLRKMKMKVLVEGKTFDYENRIIDYEVREGVKIPAVTQLEQMGISQSAKVIYYRLNPVIPASDFQPPVF
ncbi:MAG: hypothetical protein J6W00_00045 [Lentisphaeria bacterium]|nr:hypothetical protein [Lentisphaeria bacterium]